MSSEDIKSGRGALAIVSRLTSWSALRHKNILTNCNTHLQIQRAGLPLLWLTHSEDNKVYAKSLRGSPSRTPQNTKRLQSCNKLQEPVLQPFMQPIYSRWRVSGISIRTSREQNRCLQVLAYLARVYWLAIVSLSISKSFWFWYLCKWSIKVKTLWTLPFKIEIKYQLTSD